MGRNKDVTESRGLGQVPLRYTLLSPSKQKRANRGRLAPKRTWTLGDPYKVWQCVSHVENELEDELYESAVEFLETVLSSQFPEAFIPTPAQLSLLFTFISNPLFASTTQKRSSGLSGDMILGGLEGTSAADTSFEDTAVSAVSTRLISKVLKTEIPVSELGFYDMFSMDKVKSGKFPTSKRKRSANNSNDSDYDQFAPPTARRGRQSKSVNSHDSDNDGGVIKATHLKMLWPSADHNIWKIIGWAFRCASASAVAEVEGRSSSQGVRTLESRWPIWKNVLELILEMLEKDWHDALKTAEAAQQTADMEDIYRDTLIYMFLKGNEIDDYNIRWKPALHAILAQNISKDASLFRPIYPNEVNKKSRDRTFPESVHDLYQNRRSHAFGDAAAVDMRRRLIGLVYDVCTSIPNLVDKNTFFRELSLYMRDMSFTNLSSFLNPPDLVKSNKSEYSALLCDAILQPLTRCPHMPKNWIYSYENGNMYIARYLELCSMSRRSAGYEYQAEDVVKVALVVESLFRTWVKVRKTATATLARTIAMSSHVPSAIGTDTASDSLDGEDRDRLGEVMNEGIQARSALFEQVALEGRNTEDEDKWRHMESLLKTTHARLTIMMNNMKGPA